MGVFGDLRNGVQELAQKSTYERSSAMPLASVPLKVESPWCSYDQEIRTFQPEELVATKLRALYQRSKGRDLFDLWLALSVLALDPEAIAAAFPPYRPDGVTRELMRANLERKLGDRDFRNDCDKLIVGGAESCGYDAYEAAELIDGKLLSLLQPAKTALAPTLHAVSALRELYHEPQPGMPPEAAYRL